MRIGRRLVEAVICAVVAMVATANGSMAAADERSLLLVREFVLTPQQIQLISEQLRIDKNNRTETAGSSEAGVPISVGTIIPVSAPMHEFPIGLTTQVPKLSDLQFVRLIDRILIINATERIVLAEVPF